MPMTKWKKKRMEWDKHMPDPPPEDNRSPYQKACKRCNGTTNDPMGGKCVNCTDNDW